MPLLWSFLESSINRVKNYYNPLINYHTFSLDKTHCMVQNRMGVSDETSPLISYLISDLLMRTQRVLEESKLHITSLFFQLDN